jgi:hypothetical protein
MTFRQRLVRVVLWLIAGFIGIFVLFYLAVAIAMAVWFDPLKFAHGEFASEARLVIQLSEQRSLAEMYPRFIEAAASGGFVHSRGRSGPCTLEARFSDPADCRDGYNWVETEIDIEDWQDHRSVMFLFDFEFEAEFDASSAFGSSFTFVLAKNSTESLQLADWETYFDYQDNILPTLFPEADISVHETRHPAVFTDDDILRQIQRETDFEIPEKYLPAPEAP